MQPPELFKFKRHYDGSPAEISKDEMDSLLKHWVDVRFGSFELDRERCETAVKDLYRGKKFNSPKFIWLSSPQEALRQICQDIVRSGSREISLAQAMTPNWCQDETSYRALERYLNERFAGGLGNLRDGIERFKNAYQRQVYPKVNYSLFQMKENLAIEAITAVGSINSEGTLTLDDIRYLQNCLIVWPELFENLIPFLSELFWMHDSKFVGTAYTDVQAWNELVCLPFASVFFQDTCMMIDRPVQWHFDSEGYPHCGTGAAIVFGDRSQYYFWHGRPVYAHWIENPHDIRAVDVENEEDPFLKRMLRDQMGVSKYIAELNLPIVDETSQGRLFEMKCESYLPWKVLEVSSVDKSSEFVEVGFEVESVRSAFDWIKRENCRPVDCTQESIEEYCRNWIDKANSTDPVNSRQVIEAVEPIYENAGFQKPRFVFCQSPFQTILIPAMLARYAGSSMEEISGATDDIDAPRWQSVLKRIEGEFGKPLCNLTLEEIGDLKTAFELTKSLQICFNRLDMDRFCHGLDKVGTFNEPRFLNTKLHELHSELLFGYERHMALFIQRSLTSIRDQALRDAIFGENQRGEIFGFGKNSQYYEYEYSDSLFFELTTLMHEHLARYCLISELGAMCPAQETGVLSMWKKAAMAAPFYLFYERFCFVSERPTRMQRLSISMELDGMDETRPAIEYSDGYKAYRLKAVVGMESDEYDPIIET